MPSEKEVSQAIKRLTDETEAAAKFAVESTDSVKVVKAAEKLAEVVTVESHKQFVETFAEWYRGMAEFDREKGDALSGYLVSLHRLDMIPASLTDAVSEAVDKWAATEIVAKKSKGEKGTGSTEPDFLFPMFMELGGRRLAVQGQRSGTTYFNSLRHYSQEELGRKFTAEESAVIREAKKWFAEGNTSDFEKDGIRVGVLRSESAAA